MAQTTSHVLKKTHNDIWWPARAHQQDRDKNRIIVFDSSNSPCQKTLSNLTLSVKPWVKNLGFVFDGLKFDKQINSSTCSSTTGLQQTQKGPSAGERHLMVPSQRSTKSLSRTFSFTVPGWWNELPTTIWNAESLTNFKRHLKTHLFRHHLTSS